MVRYGVIDDKIQREIVLLKGGSCAWGRCAFCDYILDNTDDPETALRVNRVALSRVRGAYGRLEVVNSGSVFELDPETLALIKDVAEQKGIHTLFFEASWMYRNRLDELRKSFAPVKLVFKCGIETFDDGFRNDVLNKGIHFSHPREVAEYFDSVCLLAGIQGQTRDMLARDMEILTTYFKMGCVNIFMDNTTDIKADRDLAEWFISAYGRMDNHPGIDVLWENTDFGVGGEDDGE